MDASGAEGPAAGGAVERVVGRFMTVPRAIVAVLILASIALNFANVIARYVFLAPIIWAEEVMIFIMVWCVFLGAVLVSWDDRHLRMDLLSLHLPRRWKAAVNGLVAVASLVLFAFIAVQSFEAAQLFAELGQRSNTAGVPMVIPHAALLIGFALMFIVVAARFRTVVRGRGTGEAALVARDYGGAEGGPSPPRS